MREVAIIVSGGSGSRMGASLPKQFLLLKGTPILMHTLQSFYRSRGDSLKLILVLPEEWIRYWNELCQSHQFNVEHEVVPGGKDRFSSVKNALSFVESNIKEESCFIAVHDGVRPLLSKSLITRLFEGVAIHSAVVAGIPPVDSIRLQYEDGSNKSINRNNVWLVQTPQVFEGNLLLKAYKSTSANKVFTDDASVVEHSGHPITMIQGDSRNLKITYPQDLTIAELLLGSLET